MIYVCSCTQLSENSLFSIKMKIFRTFQKQMREYLVRLIYCEMLGHDASIGYVEAIKFAQQPNSLDKRFGKCLFLC